MEVLKLQKLNLKLCLKIMMLNLKLKLVVNIEEPNYKDIDIEYKFITEKNYSIMIKSMLTF